MLESWFQIFIVIWIVFLVISLCFGGFFMFRKFLQRMPKHEEDKQG